MNLNGVARHYDQLTPLERLPLIIAATARGDEAERQRLVHSAPLRFFREGDYGELAEELQRCAFLHLLYQLDDIALCWRAAAVLEQCGWWAKTKREKRETRELRDRVWNCLRLITYRFTARAECWKRLCADLSIDADVLLQKLPGYECVKENEGLCAKLAFTPEEAKAFLRKAHGDPTIEVETAEESAKALREHFERVASGRT